MQLASSFRYGSPMLRSDSPLSDDQIRRVAPSIFADGKHESRSDRYTYIPTIDVLRGLRNEGFQPFMVCQTRVRAQDKREFTKHLIRMRPASEITGEDVNEVILLNSHDGSSGFQLLGGVYRFVCQNGMVAGETIGEVRVPHRGNIVQNVINGAFDVLDGFDLIREQKDGMKAVTLDRDEQYAFARSALALRYDPSDTEAPAPVTESQLLAPRRFEDRRDDLWTVFQRTQENLTKGGLHGRSRSGRSMSTRPITGIDQNVKLNRALWMLADAMRQMKS
ncbi:MULTISPECIES: DUF932 domain-containing protein [Burkholderiaceae]|jgi:Domain of unknown function (DUF932)|uniref:F plasmid gene 32-like protein n=5 Tax=Burkholderiaceae TaxID=119060 RepID=Q13HQ7_PARXL|nr:MULTISPECIES: DUF932 domain-containing protein [Burkholderiaceae]MDP9550092.1 hypothetical protein [Burkholderia cepacia]UTP22397.1 DUF945 domain-containing protein [Burkholderia sp. FXe9]ABE36382.1 Conserved hypothetical protein [Paraburkholderia xenovorans LB400]AIP34644.1 hypothetical protein DR64_7963 [Paraburkholderia xenovorans LB400]MBR8394722.1 DUF945 domain-containing protein [Burkholderia cenocepacia]